MRPLPELSPLTSADSDTPVEQNRVTEGMNEKFKPADSFHAREGRKCPKKMGDVGRSMSRLKNHFLSFP